MEICIYFMISKWDVIPPNGFTSLTLKCLAKELPTVPEFRIGSIKLERDKFMRFKEGDQLKLG